MSETIAEYIVSLLGDKISPEIIAFIVSIFKSKSDLPIAAIKFKFVPFNGVKIKESAKKHKN